MTTPVAQWRPADRLNAEAVCLLFGENPRNFVQQLNVFFMGKIDFI
jgi:hypothetical protein